PIPSGNQSTSISAAGSSERRSTTSRADAEMATFPDVRTMAMALPEAEEILTWETDVTFRVRGKIFVIGGEGSDAISIKATPAVQAELIEREPTTFRPSAYVGRFGWVTANLER